MRLPPVTHREACPSLAPPQQVLPYSCFYSLCNLAGGFLAAKV